MIISIDQNLFVVMSTIYSILCLVPCICILYSVFLSKTKTKHSALKQLKIELKTILAAKLVDYKHPLINCVSSWLFFTVFIVTLKFHLKHLFYLWSTEKINSPQSKGHTSVMPLRDLNHHMYLMNCHYRVESKLLKMQICPH